MTDPAVVDETATPPHAALPPTGSEQSPQPVPHFLWLAPILASVLCVTLGALAIPALSVTIDEGAYVCEGVRSWFGDQDHLIPMGTLPCFCWAQNAAGALYLKAQYGGLPKGLGMNIEIEMGTADQLMLIRLARWTNLLLSGLGTVWAVWWVSWRWFGPRVAGAAALFAAVEPSLLAGYVLATNDTLILPFTLLAAIAFDSYVRNPSAPRLLAAAALTGLGTALKISVLPMALLLMGSCLVARALASSDSAWEAARRLAKASPRFLLIEVPLVVAVALVLSWAANGFLGGRALEPGSANRVAYSLFAMLGYSQAEQSEQVARFQALKVPAPLAVLRSQVAHSRSGHSMMLKGRVSSFGPWYYYPYVFALKTHLIMLVLGFVALANREVRRSPWPLAAALLVVLSCTTKLHQGPRYFFLLYTIWAALAGAGAWVLLDLFRQGLARYLAAAALGASSLLLTLSSAPDYLTHTSLLWGGDWEGYRYADANFDWGQGILEVFAAADARGLQPVAYFTNGTPFFGVPRGRELLAGPFFKYTDELPPRLELVETTLARMRGRFVVVPLRSLYGPLAHEQVVTIFRALRQTPPAGRLTKLYVYYDFRSPEAFAALEQAVRREIPYWVQEWEAGRRAGIVMMGPFSADPRAP